MAALLKENKPRNAIVEESFIKIINNKFKNSKVVYKYYHKKFNKNTF